MAFYTLEKTPVVYMYVHYKFTFVHLESLNGNLPDTIEFLCLESRRSCVFGRVNKGEALETCCSYLLVHDYRD